MKQIFLGCAIGLMNFLFQVAASNRKEAAQKKLKIEYTAVEWEGKLQWMQICNEIMRKSSLPGNVISQYQDSLTTFMNEAVKQLQEQMKSDTTKPKK